MRPGKTIVITVSIPARLAEILNTICEGHDFNRSQFVSSAIKERLERLGVPVREG